MLNRTQTQKFDICVPYCLLVNLWIYDTKWLSHRSLQACNVAVFQSYSSKKIYDYREKENYKLSSCGCTRGLTWAWGYCVMISAFLKTIWLEPCNTWWKPFHFRMRISKTCSFNGIIAKKYVGGLFSDEINWQIYIKDLWVCC